MGKILFKGRHGGFHCLNKENGHYARRELSNLSRTKGDYFGKQNAECFTGRGMADFQKNPKTDGLLLFWWFGSQRALKTQGYKKAMLTLWVWNTEEANDDDNYQRFTVAIITSTYPGMLLQIARLFRRDWNIDTLADTFENSAMVRIKMFVVSQNWSIWRRTNRQQTATLCRTERCCRYVKGTPPLQ